MGDQDVGDIIVDVHEVRVASRAAITALEARKDVLEKQVLPLQRDVANLLRARRVAAAGAKAERALQSSRRVDAIGIAVQYLNVLLSMVDDLKYELVPPTHLRVAVASVVYAGHVLGPKVAALRKVKALFAKFYGNFYVSEVLKISQDTAVDLDLLRKLQTTAPDEEQIREELARLAAAYVVPFDPRSFARGVGLDAATASAEHKFDHDDELWDEPIEYLVPQQENRRTHLLTSWLPISASIWGFGPIILLYLTPGVRWEPFNATYEKILCVFGITIGMISYSASKLPDIVRVKWSVLVDLQIAMAFFWSITGFTVIDNFGTLYNLSWALGWLIVCGLLLAMRPYDTPGARFWETPTERMFQHLGRNRQTVQSLILLALGLLLINPLGPGWPRWLGGGWNDVYYRWEPANVAYEDLLRSSFFVIGAMCFRASSAPWSFSALFVDWLALFAMARVFLGVIDFIAFPASFSVGHLIGDVGLWLVVAVSVTATRPPKRSVDDFRKQAAPPPEEMPEMSSHLAPLPSQESAGNLLPSQQQEALSALITMQSSLPKHTNKPGLKATASSTSLDSKGSQREVPRHNRPESARAIATGAMSSQNPKAQGSRRGGVVGGGRGSGRQTASQNSRNSSKGGSRGSRRGAPGKEGGLASMFGFNSSAGSRGSSKGKGKAKQMQTRASSSKAPASAAAPVSRSSKSTRSTSSRPERSSASRGSRGSNRRGKPVASSSKSSSGSRGSLRASVPATKAVSSSTNRRGVSSSSSARRAASSSSRNSKGGDVDLRRAANKATARRAASTSSRNSKGGDVDVRRSGNKNSARRAASSSSRNSKAGDVDVRRAANKATARRAASTSSRNSRSSRNSSRSSRGSRNGGASGPRKGKSTRRSGKS